MASNDPLQIILQSSVSGVLVKGFSQLYKRKPEFPIQFLGKWLRNYSKGQQRQLELEQIKPEKQRKMVEYEQSLAAKSAEQEKLHAQLLSSIQSKEQEWTNKINQTQFLTDLLDSYLPSNIQASCADHSNHLTGCYVGQLTYRHKRLEEHNFEPNAQYDTESPKIIEYVGANQSHQWIKGSILPNQSGRSYEVFKEQEPPGEEAEEGKVVAPKKSYLYVPQVQTDQKMHFFRFPRLGSFACFPLKIKSCLFTQAFDKGIEDYKTFVKTKQSILKQYNEKLNQTRVSYQQAKKKFEEHQLNQQDPANQAEHTNLEQQFKKTQEAFRQVQGAPPVIQPFKYEVKIKEFVLGVDTIGKDSHLSEETLNYIQKKLKFFKTSWQQKEYNMLLADILLYIQGQSQIQGLVNGFMDQQKSLMASNQSAIKEQFPNKEKQAEFELSILKCQRLVGLLSEAGLATSMGTYVRYKLPKYKQIIQIALMLLGHSKDNINLPRSNSLDHRKCINQGLIQKLVDDLNRYQLRRESSAAVGNEYKINKLLERLQKVDSEGVAKYNAWLAALLFVLKQYCWARIHCKNAKIQAHEAKVKAKNDREAQITKYDEDLIKALQTANTQAKQAATEENPSNFNEQNWKAQYSNENPRPQSLQVDELRQFLDIE